MRANMPLPARSCVRRCATGQLKSELRQEDIKRLRQMWDAGIASGSAGELDMKKLRRARLKGAMKVAGSAD